MGAVKADSIAFGTRARTAPPWRPWSTSPGR